MAKKIAADDLSFNEAAKKGNEGLETGDNTPEFSKDQLLKSNWYSHRRDVLSAILKEGETYSHAEVARLTANFMKERCK